MMTELTELETALVEEEEEPPTILDIKPTVQELQTTTCPRLIIIISGKRYSGKDFVSSLIARR